MSLSFCPTLERLYQTRELIGRSGKPFRLTSGLSTLNNILTIRNIMLEMAPKRTLEIGMACGGSTLTFAATHSELGSAPAHQHVAIDGFQLQTFDDVGRLNIQQAGLTAFVEVREELSAIALPQLVREEREFQLIYIDGSHQFEDVFCDFYFVRFLLAKGGMVLFDDSSDPHVVKVIKFIRSNLCRVFEPVSVLNYRTLSRAARVKYLIGEYLNKTQLTIFRKVEDEVGASGRTLRNF